jgi:SAM-dependent methyltransferase
MLDECARHFGISCLDLRVLDWGYGRGTTVAKLVEMGFDAYGVDIDPEPIKNGYPLFLAHGLEPQRRLVHIKAGCRTQFADGFFHVILSDQVFEHVRDLDALAREMARLTAIGGYGLHVFPAKWCVIEPHLFLPCLHWLPKNKLRYLYLRFMLRNVPLWQELQEKTAAEQTATYYNYSIEKTYYRPNRLIAQTLSKHGFGVVSHADWQPGGLIRLVSPHSWLRRTTNIFREVILITTRQTLSLA